MDDLLGFLRWPATPLWIMALALIVALFRIVPPIMERINEARRDRAEIEGEQYARIAARCTSLEEAEERCRRELADKERRLAVLEGYNDGKGKARQDAAGIVAVERLGGREKPSGR